MTNYGRKGERYTAKGAVAIAVAAASPVQL